MLTAIALITGIVFFVMFFAFCQKCELRSLLLISLIVNIFGVVTTLLLTADAVRPKNVFLYLIFTDEVITSLQVVLQAIPAQVVLAKLIPQNIEATMFGAVTGLLNFSATFWSKVLGSIINLFFGVTNDDLSKLWLLFLVSLICTTIPVFFVWIAPS